MRLTSYLLLPFLLLFPSSSASATGPRHQAASQRFQALVCFFRLVALPRTAAGASRRPSFVAPRAPRGPPSPTGARRLGRRPL